jgi:hypothetical protein
MFTWIHDINTRSEHGNTDAVCGNRSPVRRSVDTPRQATHQRPARGGDCPAVGVGYPLAVAGAATSPHYTYRWFDGQYAAHKQQIGGVGKISQPTRVSGVATKHQVDTSSCQFGSSHLGRNGNRLPDPIGGLNRTFLQSPQRTDGTMLLIQPTHPIRVQTPKRDL